MVPYLRDGVVIFDERNSINISQANLIERNSNQAFAFHSLPIYEENQTISGTFLGPNAVADSEVKMTLTDFDVIGFLGALNNGTKAWSNGSLIRLNGTGDVRFSLPGASSGAYIMSVIDNRNFNILSASPLLIVKKAISIDAPAGLKAGLPMKIRIRATPEKGNMTYGAILTSKKDYDSARLNISTNGTQKGLITNISMGNKSHEIEGLPTLSLQLLLGILVVLPPNSAAAYQQSKDPEAELNLISDEHSKNGSYILTCAVYSSGKGLIGLGQKAVEVT